MALVTVVIMGLILTILGLSLFGMATYEYNQTSDRDRSASAFWLAEAAIERAKGEIFRQQHWSVGFDSIAAGEGWYKLAIGDTTIDGDSARYIFAQGFVPRMGGRGYVERAIELFGSVGAAAFEYALFSMGNIVARGNPGVCGLVHANGEVDDGGTSLEQLSDTCRGGEEDHVSEGFEVLPPAVRTPAQYYPLDTYYYVVGEPAHPLGVGRALIFRALTPGRPVCADSLEPGAILETIRGGIRVMLKDSLDAADGVSVAYTATHVSYGLSSSAAIDRTFHWTAGECSLDTRYGDQGVVVNFGEFVAGTTPEWESNLSIDDAPSYPAPISSSVINTRYTSADTSIVALTDTDNWTGGNNTLTHVRFMPANGIALIIHGIAMSGPSHLEVGTPDDPALFYVTGSILGNFNANGNIWGTTIVLGTIDRITGNIDFHFHGGYKVELPPYLQPFWQTGSGHLKVLLWREVPPRYAS